MATQKMIQIHDVTVYDGTNGTEVHSVVGGTLMSDNGTVLEIGDGVSVMYTFNVEDGWDSLLGSIWPGSYPGVSDQWVVVEEGKILRSA